MTKDGYIIGRRKATGLTGNGTGKWYPLWTGSVGTQFGIHAPIFIGVIKAIFIINFIH